MTNCANCGTKIYGGVCPNCQEELYIYETQNEYIDELSEDFAGKVKKQKEDVKSGVNQ